jgi:hypothetical protein
MGDDSNAVRECTVEDCQCHPYRLGKNPARKGQGANEEMMKKVRESIKNGKNSTFFHQGTGSIVL